MVWTQQKQKILRSDKNTQKNYIQKYLHDPDHHDDDHHDDHSPRVRHCGI